MTARFWRIRLAALLMEFQAPPRRGLFHLGERLPRLLDRYTAPDENFVLGTPCGPRRAQRACEGAARGVGAPQATEPGGGVPSAAAALGCRSGAEPRSRPLYGALREFCSRKAPCNGRRAQRACEGAAWGVGAPRATEPGSGAEPRSSQDPT